MEQKSRTVTLKYKDISQEEFAIALHKVCQTPVENQAACAIRKVSKALNDARELISKEYATEIAERFGVKGEDGKLVPAKDGSLFTVDETKREEFVKVQEEFGQKVLDLKCFPLTPNDLRDIKLSGRDLEVMGELFDDSAPTRPQALRGPQIPRDA